MSAMPGGDQRVSKGQVRHEVGRGSSNLIGRMYINDPRVIGMKVVVVMYYCRKGKEEESRDQGDVMISRNSRFGDETH